MSDVEKKVGDSGFQKPTHETHEFYVKHQMSSLMDMRVKVEMCHDRQHVHLDLGHFDSALVAWVLETLHRDYDIIAYTDDNRQRIQARKAYTLSISFLGTSWQAVAARPLASASESKSIVVALVRQKVVPSVQEC